MADERTRQEIDTETEQLKVQIAEIGEQARESAWVVAQEGLMIRAGRIVYGGRTEGYEAVRHHPVWGEEIRAAYTRERMAGIETGPLSPVEYEERWRMTERWCDEVFAQRQAVGEIPSWSTRGAWEAQEVTAALQAATIVAEIEAQGPNVTLGPQTQRERIRATMTAAAQQHPQVVQEHEGYQYGR
jgi:hypothetical protein